MILYTDKTWLEEQYLNKRLSMREIADLEGVGETVIHKWLHRFNIPIFSRSEQLSGKQKSEEHKKHLSEAAIRRDMSGENNPNWRGGVTRWDKKIRSSKQYKEWKQACLDRDNHMCVICGSEENLQVHHIIPFARYPETRFNLGNGITLCEECHAKAHNGRLYSSPKEQVLTLINGDNSGNAEMPIPTQDSMGEDIE